MKSQRYQFTPGGRVRRYAFGFASVAECQYQERPTNKSGLREEWMKFSRREFTAGLAIGITAPYVIGSARAQGATVKIGMGVPVTGPAAEQGLWAQNGAKLPPAPLNKPGGIPHKQTSLRSDA